MLLRFHFSNVRSFRDAQELSLVATPLKDRVDAVRQPSAVKQGVLPVVGIYGANASGKTNVLRALAFVKEAVERSHRLWTPEGGVPREAFLLSDQGPENPSEFVLDFLLDEVRHQYGFAVDSQTVHEEWLFV